MSSAWGYPGWIYEEIRAYHRRVELEVEFLSSYGLREGMRALDVGCGTGTLLRALAQEGVHGVGIDSSASFLDYGSRHRDRVRTGRGRVELVEGDAFAIDFGREEMQAGTFDFVTCIFNVLPCAANLDQIAEMFASVRRLLKPNGKFVLEFALYLNFVENFKQSMVVNIFTENVNISRLISHSIRPYRATWQHDEVITVQKNDHLNTYFQRFTELVILPPMAEQMLEAAGFAIEDFWVSWRKSRVINAGSACILVASPR